MVTCYTKYLAVIGHQVDTIIEASTVKKKKTHQSLRTGKSWKTLPASLNLKTGLMNLPVSGLDVCCCFHPALSRFDVPESLQWTNDFLQLQYEV